jgi:hypothetical protein
MALLACDLSLQRRTVTRSGRQGPTPLSVGILPELNCLSQGTTVVDLLNLILPGYNERYRPMRSIEGWQRLILKMRCAVATARRVRNDQGW